MTIHGMRELRTALKDSNLTPTMEKQVLRPGLRAGGKVIQQQIKQRTPRDVSPYKDKTQLRRSIKLRAIPRSRRRIGVRITITAEHAAPVELGYFKKRRIAGQRFMRTALNESEDEAMQVLINVSRQKLPEVIRKHATKHRTTKRTK